MNPITLVNSGGKLMCLPQVTPTNPEDLINKAYVDSKTTINQINLSAYENDVSINGNLTIPLEKNTINYCTNDLNINSYISLGSGINNYISASAVDTSGNLFVGGDFTIAGGVNVNYIAKWDGTDWSALGSGLNGDVIVLAFDLNGNLFVGGNFTIAGGVSANYIAKWDGTNWSALDNGLNNAVNALAFDLNGNLFVGGYFTSTHDNLVSANYIAKWDGTDWSALGSGLDGPVNSLTCDPNGNLFVGGIFANAGGGDANNIAKWDGTDWSPLLDNGLNGSDNGLNGSVNALVCDLSGNLFVGGNFTSTHDNLVSVNYIAKWNGTWSALHNGLGNNVDALVVDLSGNLFAGGQFATIGTTISANNIAKWDGTNWHSLSNGVNNSVQTLAFNELGNNLYVGGEFTIADYDISAFCIVKIVFSTSNNNLNNLWGINLYVEVTEVSQNKRIYKSMNRDTTININVTNSGNSYPQQIFTQ